MKNKVYNLVRYHRKKLNLTQEEFASQLNVSRQTVIAIELGKYNPTLALALRISQLVGKPVESVFSLEEKGSGWDDEGL